MNIARFSKLNISSLRSKMQEYTTDTQTIENPRPISGLLKQKAQNQSYIEESRMRSQAQREVQIAQKIRRIASIGEAFSEFKAKSIDSGIIASHYFARIVYLESTRTANLIGKSLEFYPKELNEMISTIRSSLDDLSSSAFAMLFSSIEHLAVDNIPSLELLKHDAILKVTIFITIAS